MGVMLPGPFHWTDWVHVIVSTYGSWLPGDPRGFRDHDHRIHSSGDYKSPILVGEHAGLLRSAQSRVGEPVVIAEDLRPVIAELLVMKLEREEVSVRVLALSRMHGHVLCRVGGRDAKPIIGRAKQFASHRVRSRLPGRIWSQGCHAVRVRGEEHYAQVVRYIHEHEAEGAAVWVHLKYRGEAIRKSGL